MTLVGVLFIQLAPARACDCAGPVASTATWGMPDGGSTAEPVTVTPARIARDPGRSAVTDVVAAPTARAAAASDETPGDARWMLVVVGVAVIMVRLFATRSR